MNKPEAPLPKEALMNKPEAPLSKKAAPTKAEILRDRIVNLIRDFVNREGGMNSGDISLAVSAIHDALSELPISFSPSGPPA